MLMQRKYDAVLFDFDGTVAEFRHELNKAPDWYGNATGFEVVCSDESFQM